MTDTIQERLRGYIHFDLSPAGKRLKNDTEAAADYIEQLEAELEKVKNYANTLEFNSQSCVKNECDKAFQQRDELAEALRVAESYVFEAGNQKAKRKATKAKADFSIVKEALAKLEKADD